MLLASHTRITDQTRGTVCENLGQGPGIFVGDHACNGPRSSAVLRRNRRAHIVEKRPSPVVLKRPFATKQIFRAFGNYQTIQRSFASEEPRLPPVRLMVPIAESPHGCRTANKACNPIVR